MSAELAIIETIEQRDPEAQEAVAGMLGLNLPQRVSGWYVCITLTGLSGLIAAMAGSMSLLLPAEEAATSVLWIVVRVGFAVMAATFVLGMVWTLVESGPSTRNPRTKGPEGGNR